MKSGKALFGLLLLVCVLGGILRAQDVAADRDGNMRYKQELLSFQSRDPWSPRTNLNADAAMVYGIDASLPSRLDSWKSQGYRGQVMTGVAWGDYLDYFDGHFDGQFHWDEVQQYRDGRLALHGDMPRITPYISPNSAYGRYLSAQVGRAIDAGAKAIYLEEPEYYADTGWSQNFRRQWRDFYREPWQPPDSSVDAQYRASKLKYYLYRSALGQVFDSVKKYDREHGTMIRCYVATHSLINYAHWTIVSPESSLIKVGADGYIAQVWTGTARTPDVYEGRLKERTFTTAFLEYGSMQDLSRASGSRIWYLNDPVEDNPKHSWRDYRINWQSTLTASLLNPEIWRYEIMPWPNRVFDGKHPLLRNSSTRVPIPQSYATELQAVINALGVMKQENISWINSGTRDAGVLVSDTMMFERADPKPSDLNLGSFFGLALPLLKYGIPVEPVQIESATKSLLMEYRLLLLTYEGQKPPDRSFHAVLTHWVRSGGALIVVDNDDDPYNAVREWWNAAPDSYPTPRQELFVELGIPKDAVGIYTVGKGVVVSARLSPAALTYKIDGAEKIRKLAREASSSVGLAWNQTNSLVLRRGPYIVAAGLSESVPNSKPYVLRGHFIDLFDSNLPILTNVRVGPGRRYLLLDLDAIHAASAPSVIAAACRIRKESNTANEFSFLADGIQDTNAIVLVHTHRRPLRILIAGRPLDREHYQVSGDLLRLRFINSARPLPVQIDFAQ